MQEHRAIIIKEVTTFTPEIAHMIRHFVKQLDDYSQPLSDENVKFIIESENTHLYVARLQDTQQVVGMYTLVVYRIPYKMKAQLEDLVVETAFRGQGIGTQLLKHSVDKAKEYQVKSLNFTSRATRESANTLYQKFGFEKRDTNVYRKDLE